MRGRLAVGMFLLCSVGRAEDVLSKARELATSKHRAEALQMLETQLAGHPSDVDARLLYGLVLSWEGRYDEARRELRRVLADHPGYTDAAVALVRVDVWSGRRAEAVALFQQLRKSVPQDSDVIALREMLASESQPWKATFDYSSETFSGGSQWREYQLSLRRITPAGSIIGRWSRADRFGMHSNQGELEMYPHFRSGTYAYLGAGFSLDQALYPRYRAGAELFQSVGHGFEASGGFRRIVFSSPTMIYTGSVTKYRGSWMWTARMYVTPDSAGASRSIQLTARRYFGKRDDYWSLRFSRGAAPVERNSTLDVTVLNSAYVFFELNRSCLKYVGCGVRAGYGRVDRTWGSINHFTAESFLSLRF
jgi:YaiO family outer membrane protein